MSLPRVDAVDVVIKTPESEKGRDRVRKPGERGRGAHERGHHRDRLEPEEQLEGNDANSAGAPPDSLGGLGAGSPDPATRGSSEAAPDADAGGHEPQPYGPDADTGEHEPAHHIDYRA